MHEGNGGRLHLHRLFDATRKAYPRKVVPFGYVQRIATEWFRDEATCSRSTRTNELARTRAQRRVRRAGPHCLQVGTQAWLRRHRLETARVPPTSAAEYLKYTHPHAEVTVHDLVTGDTITIKTPGRGP
jgi:hypothetical protein